MNKPRKLIADLVAITPTSIETWHRCERRYLLRHVLGLPGSDTGLSNDEGLRLHAVLRFVHEQLGCQSDEYVATVLSDHDCDTDTMRSMMRRHKERCPSAIVDPVAEAVRGHHEVERARYHHKPVPMFLASARLDAVWVHDGILDIRDYKSGAKSALELHNDPRAWVQVWVLAPRAVAAEARLRLRYEYLAAEVTDDPDPWEPDADDLEFVEHQLRETVIAIRDSEFIGVSDVETCGRCPYRSVCRDSAAVGVPSWPSLAVEPNPS